MVIDITIVLDTRSEKPEMKPRLGDSKTIVRNIGIFDHTLDMKLKNTRKDWQ